MSFDAVRESAETKINTWGVLPASYDNVQFDSSSYDEWVRVTVIDGESFPRSIVGGSCKVRRTGFVSVQIFTKQWLGSSLARQYADDISNLFSNTSDGTIVYETASGLRVGHSEDVYQYNVLIPFIYDEV
jgi:hypothetical protein